MQHWIGSRGEETLAARLGRFRVLASMAPETLADIAEEVRGFCLPAGQELPRDGAFARALFLVASGSLSVAVTSASGEMEEVATIPAGETVGEMSLITDEPPSARLFAVRDSELFMLDKPAFERLAHAHPALMRELCVIMAERLRRTTMRVRDRTASRTVALVAAEPGLDMMGLAAEITDALSDTGLSIWTIDARDAQQPTDWFHRIEAAHDLVLYIADDPRDPWRRRAERRADRVFVVAREAPPASSDGSARAGETDRAAPEWVLIVDDRPNPSAVTSARGLTHIVRRDHPKDVGRLARFMAGRAIGLVLSGGGARGFAHLGVVRALRQAGVPIDAVGGTSMGAIIAAGVAMEWDDAELAHRMRDAFVLTNPLTDVAVPLVAFFRGHKVAQLFDRHFGSARIENLPVPFFCVTSDLTAGTDAVQRAGPVARALRATVALPGVLPPVVFGGHVHVDGGVMNNLPVEHMTRMAPGGVIASDVSGDTALLPGTHKGATPGILSILVRTGTVGNEWQRREARRQALHVFEPMVADVGFRDWQAFDRASQRGFDHTRARLMEDPGLLERLGVSWSDAHPTQFTAAP